MRINTIVFSLLLPLIAERTLKIKMKRNILYYLALFVSVILLIKSMSELDFENLSNGPFSGIVSYTFFAILFIKLIKEQKEKPNSHSKTQ
jgi:asparagine N-glycosylation enzyme membrane subunit Stt3